MPAATPKPALPPLEGITLRKAAPADNDQLLALTRATPMAGTIALRIDREPDFFALLRARGDFVLFVATHAGQIIGCMSLAVYPAYIEGKLERIAHVGDLKVHPDFTGRKLALHLVSACERHLRDHGIDLSFNLVADGNTRVMTIAKGKHGTPIQVMLGRFFVDEMIPTPFRRRPKTCTIANATPADVPAIAALLDDFASQRNFARPSTSAEIERRLASLTTKTLVARLGGCVVATLALDDTSHLRRNVPVGLPPHLRLMLPILALIPGIRPPRLNQPIRMLYLRWTACAPEHLVALKALIAEARFLAFQQKVSFLSIGLHERDPLRVALAGIPRFTFTSRAMAASLFTDRRVESLVDRVPYEDFALV